MSLRKWQNQTKEERTKLQGRKNALNSESTIRGEEMRSKIYKGILSIGFDDNREKSHISFLRHWEEVGGVNSRIRNTEEEQGGG